MYECIENFQVNEVDDDGYDEGSRKINIRKGSMWQLNSDVTTLTGADLRLEEINGASWLELSRERLANFFKEI